MPSPQITVSTPLGGDLRFEAMSVTEGLSTLGGMQLSLVSPRADLKPEDLLGQPVTVAVQLRDSQRFFNGYVTRFGAGRHQGRYYGYTATVQPWLWFLGRTSDCRIFTPENIGDDGGEAPNTVPNIVKKVFKDHGVADFEFKLFRAGEYREWPYCVQYRETDLNFVTRLLEHEGIYWYFQHSDGKHKLVLVDMLSVHDPAPGYEMLPYFANAEAAPPDTEYVSEWSFSREVRSGKLALASYDFERPSSPHLAVERAEERPHPLSDYEQFDFQGDYVTPEHGKMYVENRIDEQQARFERIAGRSNAHGLASGHLFSLLNPPHTAHGSQFLCTSTHIEARSDGGESTGRPGSFDCSFTAIPAGQQFRPVRRTVKPRVQGPQTAMVTGPAGEEIHTDKYGRVKVQFHWDRYGKSDEKSSCWIRTSQPWAGKGWGSVSIPRIGQEVIVDFLEGDPDQPIITGRVYNAEAMPPYTLPGEAVVSGLKSQTHKGQGYNEMSMNDTAGKEGITIHAQYDMGTTVQHDQTNTVNNTFTETIKSDTKITITEGTYSHDVAANTATYHVQAALTENYDATQTTTVKNDIITKSTAGSIQVTSDTAHVFIDAATSIKLHVGASTIEMDAAGNITIDGVNVAIKGSASVTIKGGMVHSEADSEHQTKGAIVLSDGSATNTVKGGMVMLNP